MSGTAISQLPAALSALPTDLMPVVEIGTPNVTKRITVAQLMANTVPPTGGVFNGVVEFNQGLLLDNNQYLQWRDTTGNPQNVITLDSSNNVVLKTYGTQFSLENSTGTVLAAVTTGGNLNAMGNLSAGGTLSLGGAAGVSYTHGSAHAFSWDGSFVHAWVNNTDVGSLATVGWANSTFATPGYVSGNFKPISAYTPNQNVDTGQSPTFGDLHVNGNLAVNVNANVVNDLGVGGWMSVGSNGIFYTATGGTNAFQIWYNGSGTCFIRMNGSFDFGPINLVSDARLKQDIAPATIDCLDVLRRIELKQFAWKESGAAVPVGFVTEQLKTAIPEAVNEAPEDFPPYTGEEEGTFYESVDANVMLALLAGAVQQLAARLEAVEKRG